MRSINGGKMLKTTLAFFIFVVCTCEAAVVETKSNISPKPQHSRENITNVRVLCSTSTFLNNSNFVKTCANETFLDALTELNITNKQSFFCLGMYDACHRICLLGSKNLLPANLPSNATEFDKKLTEMKSEPNFEDNVCLKFTEPKYKPTLEGYAKEINILNQVLRNNHWCNQFCYKAGGGVEPLCVVLAWTNQHVIKKIEKLENTVNKSPELPGGKANGVDETARGSGKELKIPGGSPKSGNNPKNNEADNSLPENSGSRTPELLGGKANGADGIASGSGKGLKTAGDSPTSGNHLKNNNADNVQVNEGSEGLESNPRPLEKSDEGSSSGQGNSSNKNTTNVVSSAGQNNSVTTKQAEEVSNKKSTTAPGNVSPKPQNYTSQTNVPLEAAQPGDATNDRITSEQSENVVENKVSIPVHSPADDEDEYPFFAYFMAFVLFSIGGYFCYHNKNKILAMVFEGRKSKGGRGRRRPNTSAYRKLDCTLEEAVTSKCKSDVTHVIY